MSIRRIDSRDLQEERASRTFVDGILHGRPDYAIRWYEWGVNSPYYLQDAFYLLSAVVLGVFCLPALLVRLVCGLFSGSMKEVSFDLQDALKVIFVGLGKGFFVLLQAPFRDSAKWITMKARDVRVPQCQKTALLVIDMQKDFFSGGSLAVGEAESTLPIVQELVARKREGVLYIASQDWHPASHGSFAENLEVVPFSETTLNGVPQVAWPVHCVQGTAGADFVEGLPIPDVVIQKGQDPRNDSYSAVSDQGKEPKETKLLSHLQAEGVKRLFVCGVATDYCVRATVEDLTKQGFDVVVIEDACRGVFAGLTGDAKQQAYQAIKVRLEGCGARFMPAKQLMHDYPQQFTQDHS